MAFSQRIACPARTHNKVNSVYFWASKRAIKMKLTPPQSAVINFPFKGRLCSRRSLQSHKCCEIFCARRTSRLLAELGSFLEAPVKHSSLHTRLVLDISFFLFHISISVAIKLLQMSLYIYFYIIAAAENKNGISLYFNPARLCWSVIISDGSRRLCYLCSSRDILWSPVCISYFSRYVAVVFLAGR